MKLAWQALLQSRKFWMAVLGLIGGIILYLQAAITAEQLADLIVAMMGILIGAIAVEDAAEKRAGGSQSITNNYTGQEPD